MKKISLMVLSLFLPMILAFANSGEKVETVTTDEYKLTMNIKVPRIYDNMQSLGYRKYQSQTIKGYLKISYRSNGKYLISIQGLYNKTHKINGKNITYSTIVDNEGNYVFPRISYVGNNKRNEFKVPNIIFYMDAEPSYNIGEDDPDNSLLLYVSGIGTSKKEGSGRLIKSFNGLITGTLGCGCHAYGHVSPTRKAGVNGPTDEVTDVAAVYGKWAARYYRSYREKITIDEE